MKKIITILSLIISTITYAQIPTNGLVGWWPFSGNAFDSSGNGNHGVVTGAVLTTDRFGNANSAYSFDGDGDFINCGNSASVNITGSLTIHAWVYANDLVDEHGIVSKGPVPPVGSSYDLQTNSNNLRFLNEFTSSPPMTTGSWINVVSVFDSSQRKICFYINGSCIDSLNTSFDSIEVGPEDLYIGTHRPLFTNTWSWDGKLDDIGIWNRPLTPQEITNLFNGDGNPCSVYDTIHVSVYDTTHISVYDTTHVTVNDTNYVTEYDTVLVSVTDTLIINAVLTGVAPPNNVNTMKVFPNPANTHIYINNGNYNQMNGYTLKITNALGQTVFTSLINQQIFYIDLSTWTGSGTYFLHVIDSSQSTIETKTIVLQ